MKTGKSLEKSLNKIANKDRKYLGVFVYAYLYYRSNEPGYTVDFIKNLYNHLDIESGDKLDFYWIGFEEGQSGIEMNDISNAGEHGIYFDPNTYIKEFEFLSSSTNNNSLNWKGITLVITENVTTLQQFIQSDKLIIDLSNKAFHSSDIREAFIDLIIECSQHYENGYKSFDKVFERLNSFKISQKGITTVINLANIVTLVRGIVPGT